MKKSITFLTVLILSLLASTNAKASQLYLRTNTGSYVSANISGYVYSSRNGEIRAHDLRPGNHFITVTAKNLNRRPSRSYREANHRSRDRVIYRGRIHIPNSSTVYARISPRGHLLIERVISHRHKPKSYKKRGPRYTPAPPPQRNHRRRGDYGNVEAFNNALDMVESASFSSEKLAIAKQYARSNQLTSNQVLQLTNAFDFESSKLHFAKYAYDYTIDPQNYFVVNKAFDFSSSVLALNKYIG